jgi:Protein of unknown function DUF104
MALKVDASFEDGVFVPVRRPALADRERVRLTIESVATAQPHSKGLDQADGEGNSSSRTGPDLAIALDFHPDGC